MEKEVKITFETITPVWTGDAFGRNDEIRLSSIMGSLRFWFEVVSYFSGVTNNDDYNGNGKDNDPNRIFVLRDKLDYEVFKREFLNNKINKYKTIDRILANSGISLPSRVFGCTGWKSMIRIKEIKKVAKKEYNFPRGRVEFEELKHTKIKKGKEEEATPAWYFPTGFYGELYITFLVHDILLKPVFYPLLTFIEKFGFVGGKWNIGYGRLKIKEVKENGNSVGNWRNEEFGFNEFYKNNKETFRKRSFNDLTKEASDFGDLEKPYAKKVFFYYINNPDDNFNNSDDNSGDNSVKAVITYLIKEKASQRSEFRDNYYLRHNIFGTISRVAIGSKILPWISTDKDEGLRYGFISIAPIIQLGKQDKGGKNARK